MSVDVKICGLTNRDDAMVALEAGADYIGFVLYPESPRGISAARMIDVLDAIDVPFKAVGVFVNERPEDVRQIADEAGLYAVQLHGDEEPGDGWALECPVWRAVRLSADETRPPVSGWDVERFVVDAAVDGTYGGTGQKADWSVAREFARQHSCMLAGGLTPANVSDAIRDVQPMGVDTASGVESQPGKKDARAVRTFIRRAKERMVDGSG